MFRRPGPRFLLWVVVLIGVAAAAGFAHFAWWLIAVLEFAAWALVAVVERSLSIPGAAAHGALPLPPPPPVAEFEELSYVRVLAPGGSAVQPEPAPEPVHVSVTEPEPEPAPPPRSPVVPEPLPALTAVAPPPERKGGLISRPFRSAAARVEPTVSRRGRTFGGQPVQWNIWNLERVAREQAGDNDELGFIVTYLRDYANPDGLLPTSFDSLVRESFGDLLGYAAV